MAPAVKFGLFICVNNYRAGCKYGGKICIFNSCEITVKFLFNFIKYAITYMYDHLSNKNPSSDYYTPWVHVLLYLNIYINRDRKVTLKAGSSDINT